MTIRQPVAVYEFDGNGADAVGNWPAAEENGSSGPGLMGTAWGGASQNDDAGEKLFLFGGSGSCGVWINITAGDLAWEFGNGLYEIYVFDELPSLRIGIGCDGTNIQMFLDAKTEVTPVTTAGWHHFAFTRVGNLTQFYVNGVAVGAAELIVPIDEGFEVSAFAINPAEGGGKFDQLVFADVAYTAEEWTEIYNGGAGLPYAQWNGGGGDETPARRRNRRRMTAG